MNIRIAIVSLSLIALVSCKKKVIVKGNSNTPESENAVPSGEWRGDKDMVDETLGSLKNID